METYDVFAQRGDEKREEIAQIYSEEKKKPKRVLRQKKVVAV